MRVCVRAAPAACGSACMQPLLHARRFHLHARCACICVIVHVKSACMRACSQPRVRPCLQRLHAGSRKKRAPTAACNRPSPTRGAACMNETASREAASLLEGQSERRNTAALPVVLSSVLACWYAPHPSASQLATWLARVSAASGLQLQSR